MSYLLDTHAFLWSVFDPDQISKKARRIIETFENLPFLSFPRKWESRKLLKTLDSRLRGNDKERNF